MANGMTLEELTQLARCNGLHTMTFKPNRGNALSHEKLDSAIIEHRHSEPLNTEDVCCKKSKTPVENDDDQAAQIQTSTDSSSATSDDEANEHFLISHNMCASYLHGSDFDLFQAAIVASSQIEGF